MGRGRNREILLNGYTVSVGVIKKKNLEIDTI